MSLSSGIFKLQDLLLCLVMIDGFSQKGTALHNDIKRDNVMQWYRKWDSMTIIYPERASVTPWYQKGTVSHNDFQK